MKTLAANSTVPRSVSHAPVLQTTGWRGPLALWHLLSLDAPTVATVWTIFVARTWRLALPASVPCAMFLAVWAIYAADRLLDARRRQEGLEARHRFHGRHRRLFQAALGVAATGLIPCILVMPAAMRGLYLWLGALLLLWLGVIHLLPRSRSRRNIPKELAVGVFFSAAIFLPTAATIPSLSLLVAAAFTANLCSLNCLFIYAWEHPRGAPARSHASTRFGLRRLRAIGTASVLLPIAMLPLAAQAAPALTAVSIAAGLLLALDRTRSRYERTTLRAAADLALLTPLLLLPFLR